MQGDTAMSILVTIICIVLTFALFYFYYKKKINTIELILYSYACQAFNISILTGTSTPFFFVSSYISTIEFIKIITGKTKISLVIILLLTLPIFSSIFSAILIGNNVDIFEGTNPDIGTIFYNAIIFYIKFFLPFVFLGFRVYKESKLYSIDQIFNVIIKVAIVSCYIGLFQFFLSNITDDPYLLRIAGLRSGFVISGQSSTTRISAFFVEPKALSAFLAIAIPLLLQKKRYYKVILLLITGLLTASQTFIVGVFLVFILFFLIKRTKRLRINILLSLLILMVMFVGISSMKLLIYSFYSSHQNNFFVKIVLKRAVDRYDINNAGADEFQVYGLPLQKDEELPMYMFFAKKPWLYLLGYGLKNGGYVPKSYYIFNDESFKEIGTLTYTLDMRWYFYVCEAGLIVFIIWFFYFTKPFNINISKFQNKYYAFLWALLFFSNIDVPIILIYAAYIGIEYKKVSKTMFAGKYSLIT